MFIYILIYICTNYILNIFLNIAVCSNKGLELQSYIKSKSSPCGRKLFENRRKTNVLRE